MVVPATSSTKDRSRLAPALIEADCQHRQQIGIERGQGLIDGELHVIGRCQHEGLQHQGQHQNLQQCTLDPGHALPQLRQPQPFALFAGLEIVARAQLQRHPSEVI